MVPTIHDSLPHVLRGGRSQKKRKKKKKRESGDGKAKKKREREIGDGFFLPFKRRIISCVFLVFFFNSF